MHDTTAAFLLRRLARLDLVKATGTTYMVPRYPQVVHPSDVKEAFRALALSFKSKGGELVIAENFGVEALCSGKLFEKIFRVVFVAEKLYPGAIEGSGSSGGRDLPYLFVGAEKTQVRQIPLVDRPPWPFKFLLQLGGMVVIRYPYMMGVMRELRQFINNHPQFEIRVDAKEAPDSTIVIYTWWFRELGRLEKKKNLNVPY